MTSTIIQFDGIEYRVSGPDRRISDDAGNAATDLTISRVDGRKISGCDDHPGMIQTHKESAMPKGLMRRARAALAIEQRRYERMTDKAYRYGEPGSERARQNARGKF